MPKIATSLTAIGLSLCMVVAAAAAKQGGGHPGGGGGHRGGGGGHPGGGGAHFTARAASHFSGRAVGGGSHFTAHVSHGAGSSFHTAVHSSATHTEALSHAVTPSSVHSLATTRRTAAFTRVDPRSFAAHRSFAASAAFHPFVGHGWHPYHHVGWLGPLFWPYAYGDFFYYALWPSDYGYYDPFWVYGYGDIYEGIFSPYGYDEYVQGPQAPARMASLTQSMEQSCAQEAAEVTNWPIDQIQTAVQPNPDQSALLDDLGNAVVKASDVIQSHCPATVSFTPTGRLDDMQQRLQGMVQAVDIVGQPLSKFYDSLSDEQKARFNDIGASAAPQNGQASTAPNPQASNAPNPQAQCGASVMAFPSDQINRAVQPNDTQQAKLQTLQAAMANAANTIKAACPTEMPSTPPARLEAAGKHLQAMLQAVDAIRPPLHDFYDSLSDDQKARFNTLGAQLFAQTQE
jgi:LTXXQ motif family protein